MCWPRSADSEVVSVGEFLRSFPLLTQPGHSCAPTGDMQWGVWAYLAERCYDHHDNIQCIVDVTFLTRKFAEKKSSCTFHRVGSVCGYYNQSYSVHIGTSKHTIFRLGYFWKSDYFLFSYIPIQLLHMYTPACLDETRFYFQKDERFTNSRLLPNLSLQHIQTDASPQYSDIIIMYMQSRASWSKFTVQCGKVWCLHPVEVAGLSTCNLCLTPSSPAPLLPPTVLTSCLASQYGILDIGDIAPKAAQVIVSLHYHPSLPA